MLGFVRLLGTFGYAGGVSAIDATRPARASGLWQPARFPTRAIIAVTVLLVVLMIALFSFSASAFAALSSTGELAFFPCTRCHPVFIGPDGKPTKPLPIGLKKHEIKLEKHDILGKGTQACLACHDSPQKNPGMLILPDGSLVPVNGDTSRVCQRCHFEKYQQFKAGIHGKHKEKCTSAGCHDPHTPSWIYVGGLPPFQGTGIEVKAVGVNREPFKPMASPPVPPPVETPLGFAIASVIGVLVAAGLVVSMVLGRSKR